MKYIADLHIHSPFSRATSKSSNLPGLAAWAAIKGIDVLGTGDFTHPGWFRQISEKLQPAEPGFFKLGDAHIPPVFEIDRDQKTDACRFVLSAEISSIYKRHGKVRKIHNVIFVPDLESAARINTRLAGVGNIESDGRPILGLDARDLLEIVLEAAPEGFLVPAHIWTPWFSLFGSKSGFDAIEECYGDLSQHIFALETGLSSDPDMNRLVSALDRFTLISNSDCHSPGKLGREANLFTCGFNFFSMRDALKNPALGGFQGTIEFFPEEGKYHHDGHRKCGINLNPAQTRNIDSICPVCAKPLTIGVMHRVMELADREVPFYPPNSPGYFSLIPLPEVLGEIFSKGPATKTVFKEYGKLIRMFDSEFNLMLNVPAEEINERYSPVLGEAVQRIRKGKVIRRAGFDGEFGVIKVFDEGELKELVGQSALFEKKKTPKKTDPLIKPSLFDYTPTAKETGTQVAKKSLNQEQSAAVSSDARYVVVTAGPGTGKTHTLVARIKRLVQEVGARPEKIIAITFTNRAADEMRERLGSISGLDVEKLFIGTFHAFCLDLLRENGQELTVIDEKARDTLIARIFHEISSHDCKKISDRIESFYTGLACGLRPPDREEMDGRVEAYLNELNKRDGIDLSGIVPQVVYRLKTDEHFAKKVSAAVQYLFIDEFQDLNRSQYELVRLLAIDSSVFAIGDPDQAIYGFRGSSPKFFHLFIDEFAAVNLTLRKNYRSATKILEAAAAVIVNNHGAESQHCVTLNAQLDEPGTIELYRAGSPEAEAEFVVRHIEELMGGISHFSIDSGRGRIKEHEVGRTFKDFGVFYRLTQQAECLSKALERRGIPFQMVNVRPFFMRREIRPLYYWVRAAARMNSEAVETEAYLELLRTFPGVGANSLALLEKQLPFGGLTDFFALVSEITLPKSLQERVEDIHYNLAGFRDEVLANGLWESVEKKMEYLRVNPKNPVAKRFLELAGSFGSDLKGFAAYLHKNENATVYDERAAAVSLMTLHAAKGLEFPVVFITGMEEGVFPCDFPAVSRDEGITTVAPSIHEERRLFYVGMTRARDSLILTSSAARPIFGNYQRRDVSSFVNEIPASLCEQIKQQRTKKKKTGAKQMKLF
jgi:uncharacterized protein (TIGR00375 family)